MLVFLLFTVVCSIRRSFGSGPTHGDGYEVRIFWDLKPFIESPRLQMLTVCQFHRFIYKHTQPPVDTCHPSCPENSENLPEWATLMSSCNIGCK